MNFTTELFEKFFSYGDKINDPNKDENGEGTLERFVSCTGEELDRIKDLVDNLILNVVDVDQCYDRFVPFLESGAGFDRLNDTLYLLPDIVMRRAILRALPYLHTVKGTLLGYSVPLGYLGIAITINDEYEGYGFDSPVTLDDPERRLDSYLIDEIPYSISLTGTRPVTGELMRALRSIIVFNQPVDMRLINISYNGTVIKELTGDYSKDFSDDFFTVL